MRILITGGNGFIGKHLRKELRDYDVSAPTSSEADIMVLDDMLEATRGADAVIHLAAKSHRSDFTTRPLKAYETNVVGTKNVLEAVEKNNAEWFLFASSGLVYEPSPASLKEASPLRKDNHYYARSKIRGEQLCTQYALTTCAPRVFNAYGPGQEHQERIVPDFIKKAQRGRINILGDAREALDLIHVKDVVKAMRTLLEHRATGVYNVGSGVKTTFGELANTIADKVLGEPKISDEPKEIVPHPRIANIDKLKALNWRPRIGLSEGIESMLRTGYEPNPIA